MVAGPSSKRFSQRQHTLPRRYNKENKSYSRGDKINTNSVSDSLVMQNTMQSECNLQGNAKSCAVVSDTILIGGRAGFGVVENSWQMQ